ncbi:MAG: LicD family protein [Erysipelothrix sp.]
MNLIDNTMTRELIREMQLNELYLLKEFSKFCKKYEIPFTLDFGSILGAVRHEGFIPWDDDIDIAILRWDYNKFLKLAKNWNHQDIFVQNFETDEYFVHSFTRLRLNKSLALQDEWSHLDVHHGIFIDIFPYDAIPNNEVEMIQHEKEIFEIQKAKLKRVKLLKEKNLIKWKSAKDDHDLCMRSLRELNEMQTEVMSRFNYDVERNDLVSHMTQGFESYFENRRTVNDILDSKDMIFENLLMPIPNNYEGFLNNTYGDYLVLPPQTERFPHHGLIEVIINKEINCKYFKY